MKKFITWSFFLIIIFAADMRMLGDVPAKSRPNVVVAVEKVGETEDIDSRRYTGLVVSQSEVHIKARVSGEILRIGFKDGALVKKGQMLYQLDSTQYEAAVKSAEAKVTECEARVEYAKNNFIRQYSLYEKKAVSRDAMENSKSTLKAYQASLLAAKAALITARDDYKNTTISAPLDGIAGVTSFTAGNYVTPSSGEMLKIIQVKPIRVRFSISTVDLLSLFGGPRELLEKGIVRVKLSDGSMYPTAGKIELLNNEANSKTDAIQVFANFPNHDYRLIVGSTVGVTLSKSQGHMVPAILPSAVMHDNKGSYVYVVNKANKVEKRYIVTGNSKSGLQIIISGLKTGETVIVKGTHKTMPGGQVEPIPAGE
ncbi:MAG: efflux RND transporter periplasmic adaptor subunit [Victivallaceae bacterium]|nr:efflux RND transporter periplasmic adaptor subunit [Victivallaceae bacterium]